MVLGRFNVVYGMRMSRLYGGLTFCVLHEYLFYLFDHCASLVGNYE